MALELSYQDKLQHNYIEKKTLKCQQNQARRAETNPAETCSESSRLDSPRGAAQEAAEQKDQCPDY